jgi:hypothetical protein
MPPGDDIVVIDLASDQMKRLLYLVPAVLIVAMLASGCGSPADDNEIKPAPIHDVSVTVLMSNPPQVEVYIKGGLADGCTVFHELNWERDGKTVKITVTVERPREAVCTEVYGFFEKTVNLGTDFVSGETYTVNVNDKTTSFTML